MVDDRLPSRLSATRRWLIARRELAALRREKTILLAILIQLFIAAFSSFLLVGLVSLYDPSGVAGSGVVLGVTGNASGLVIDTFENEDTPKLVEFDDEGAAESAFSEGRIDGVLVVSEQASGRLRVEAVAPDESVRSTLIVVELRDLLQRLERQRRLALADRLGRDPVPLPDVPTVPPTFGFTYTVLIPLLVFLPVFVAGSVATDTITEEFDTGTLELLRVTPLSPAEIVEGKMLAMVALVPLQAGAWLLLLRLNGTLIAHPGAILVLATATGVMSVALGSRLALRFQQRQSAQLLYSILIILAFVMASALPETPVNAVAKLAIGSAGVGPALLIVGYVVVAVAAYWVVRATATDVLR